MTAVMNMSVKSVPQMEEYPMEYQPMMVSQTAMEGTPSSMVLDIGYSPVEQPLLVPADDEEERSSAIDKTKYKTRLCRNWAGGNECPYGDRCVFAHGDHEKRKGSDPLQLESLPLKRTESVGSSARLATALSTPLDSSTTWYQAEPAVQNYSFHYSNGTPTTAEPQYLEASFATVPEQEYEYGQDIERQHSEVSAPTPVATLYRFEPYMGDTVCRVAVHEASAFVLAHTATTESNGLSDGGASESTSDSEPHTAYPYSQE
eukprot:TRINITY_DN1169_c0_g1_i1.p1 TRINITY_DN1169_c0_g1~~TRINITY_DN1169_c0_g1_i1.p1  ORF type:complete len:260 (+),score=86.47 TRINITY_DN1169_c0_g1_i1:157-936(+)